MLNLTQSKSVPIVWMVSNCHAHSNREEYLLALSKYLQVFKDFRPCSLRFLQVDIFGTCGNTSNYGSQLSIMSRYLPNSFLVHICLKCYYFFVFSCQMELFQTTTEVCSRRNEQQACLELASRKYWFVLYMQIK